MFCYKIEEKNEKKNNYNSYSGHECLDFSMTKKINSIIFSQDVPIFYYLKYITDENFVKRCYNCVIIEYVYSYELYDLNSYFKNDEDVMHIKKVIEKQELNDKIENLSQIELFDRSNYYKLKKIKETFEFTKFFKLNLFELINKYDYEDLIAIQKSDYKKLQVQKYDYNFEHVNIENAVKMLDYLFKESDNQLIKDCCDFIIKVSILNLLNDELLNGNTYIVQSDLKRIVNYVKKIEKIEKKSKLIVNVLEFLNNEYKQNELTNMINYNITTFQNENKWKLIIPVSYDRTVYIHLLKVWKEIFSLCEIFNKLLNTNNFYEISINENNLSNEQNQFLQNALSLDGIHVLNGRAGTGKTFIIGRFIYYYTKILNKKLALLSFQGSTVSRSIKIFGEYGIYINTVDKFLNNNKNGLIKNLDQLNCLIIEEATLLSLSKYSKLLDTIKHIDKLILIGDKDQMLSIEYGSVFEDIYSYMKYYKEKNAYNFENNNRFSGKYSLIHNMNLIYDNSGNITQEFIYNDENSCAINYKNDKEFEIILENIIKNSESKDYLFYCHKVSDSKNFNTELSKIKCIKNHDFKESNELHANERLKIGDTIKNNKNHDEFNIDNVYILKEEDLKNGIQPFQMIRHIHNKEVKLESFYNTYLSNGFRDVIKDIKYGFHFKIDDIVKKSNIDKLKEYPYQFVKIYQTKDNQNIITGKDYIYENNLTVGYCLTLDTVQGSECSVCIFIIPNNIKIFNNFYDSRRLLVACTRSTNKMYYLYQKIPYNQKDLDNWCKKNNFTLKPKDSDYLSFEEAIQVMSINKSSSRRSILNIMLKLKN